MERPTDRTSVALLVALPAFLLLGLVLPEWFRFLLQVSLANALAVVGVMVQLRAGLVSFGQGLYYCLGGYAAGMAGHLWGITDVFVLLVLAIAVSVLVACVLGLLMSRYREIFFAMLSLALSMILYGLLVKAEALGSTDGFNVPPSTFAGMTLEGYAIYTLACVLAFGVALGLNRYLGSTLGRLADAVRENELRVEYLGASARRAVYVKYVLAASVSAVGGVLFAVTNGHVSPDMAYWTTSGEFVFVALLSGTGNVSAPFVGAILLEILRSYAFEYSPYTWQIILGSVMLLVILFLPGGLWSLITARGGQR